MSHLLLIYELISIQCRSKSHLIEVFMKKKIIQTSREIAGILMMFTAGAAVVLLQITTWI